MLPEDKPEPTDWVQVDRVIIKRSEGRLGLQDIDEMTLAEIAFYLDDWDAPRPTIGSRLCGSPQEAFERAEKWKKMTPQERLQRMREERDG